MASQREQERRKSKGRITAKQWTEKQDSGSGTFAVKTPDGYKRYKLEEDTHQFDIIPFLCGNRHPEADEAGYECPDVRFGVHKIPRPDGKFDYFLCKWETYKKTCELCLWRKEKAQSKEESDALWAQVRHLFYVNDKPGDTKNPIKVFDTVHFNRKLGFGEQLQLALTALRNESEEAFSLKEGRTVQVICTDSKYQQVGRLDLLPRKYSYPDSYIDKLPPLDECLVEPDIDAALSLLSGGAPKSTVGKPSENGDDEGDSPRRRPRDDEDGRPAARSRDDEDEGEEEDNKAPRKSKKSSKEPTADEYDLTKGDLVRYKGEECEILKISGDGTSLTLEREDTEDEPFRGVSPADVKKITDEEPEEEEDEDERPAKSAKTQSKPSRKSRASEDEDEEDEDPDEEEEDSEEEEDEEEDSDDDDDSFEEDEEDDDEPAAKKQPAKKTTTKPKSRR